MTQFTAKITSENSDDEWNIYKTGEIQTPCSEKPLTKDSFGNSEYAHVNINLQPPTIMINKKESQTNISEYQNLH